MNLRKHFVLAVVAILFAGCLIRSGPKNELERVEILIDPKAEVGQVNPKEVTVKSVGGVVVFKMVNLSLGEEVVIRFEGNRNGKDPFKHQRGETHPEPGTLKLHGSGEFEFVTDKRAGFRPDRWQYTVIYGEKQLDPIIKTVDID